MTSATIYSWVFDSNACEVLGHRPGCSDLRKSARYPGGKKIAARIYMGDATEASELDDMDHPVRMCNCTK